MGPPSVVAALCLTVFFGVGFGGPILPQEPSQCVNSLPVGKTFVYLFNGLNKIENDDVNQEVSFSSEVVVSVPAPCVLGVQMRAVVSPHQKFVEALEKHPIEVYMDSGIVTGIKHHPSEPAWAVNVKRAVVSMLQAPLDAREASAEVTERDILGECETSYTAQPTDDQFAKVTKTKKLLSCQGRFQEDHAIFSMPYAAPTSDIRTAPLSSGTYICHQSISKENGVLRTAECQQREKLYLNQQSSTKPGIISSISAESSIALRGEEEGAQRVQSTDFRKSSLKFDHRYALEHATESLVLAVNRYCEAMRADVRPETGKLFQDLIKSMRGTSFDKILGVYQMLDSKPCDTGKLKKAFLDVLGMAGTPGAVRMMAEFIGNGEKREHEQDWLASLAYLAAPTEDMIEAFVPVVEKAEPAQAKRVFLPVAAMANTFCKLHGEDCQQVPAVHRLLTALVQKLQSRCSADRAYVVAALKAIGNLGVVGEHSDAIMACLKTEATDLRLYTLGAFRKVCKADLVNRMVAIYSDYDEDSEVRIAAYLNAMRCADFDVIGKIVRTYENEKMHQVGSFVYSHMKNVLDSECPLKAALKQLIASFPISSKFSKDPTMFSQHYEFSKFYDFANVGGAADASIVFSPKSFLPRSAALNLTVDLFSHSFNLLEVGGRVEGLEQILEQLMGPRTELGKTITSELSRAKRATGKNFKNPELNAPEKQKMAFYVNVFGNEIDFVEFDSMKDFATHMLTSAMSIARYHPSNLLNEIVLAGEIDVAKNVILADNRMTGATISGVGLAADLRAVSNVIIKASAPMPTDNKEMKATLEPSAVVQVDASLTLDAGAFRHGARLASTIHTSSVVDVLIVKTDDEFKFRFNTPRDKIELLNARSEVFVIHGDYESRVEPGTTRTLDGCTIQLPEVIGMKACITGTVPKPWYIARRGFVKPFDFALTIDKTDKTMEGIEFRAVKTSEKFSLTFDTPGSTVDRKREFVVQKITGEEMGLQLVWQCPKIHVQTELAYPRMVDGTHRFVTTIKNKETNEVDEYSLRMFNKDMQTVYFEAKCPYLSETATLTVSKLDNSLEVTSNYPLEKPLRIRAEFGQTDAGYLMESSLSVKGIDATTKVTLVNSRDLLHGTFNAEYTLEGSKTEKASYELKIKKANTESGYHYNGVSTWSSTCHPDYNNKATFDVIRAGDSRKHKMQIWWGGQFRDETKTLKLNFDAKRKGCFGFGSTSTVQLFIQAYSPAFGLNWEAKYNNKFDLQLTPRITSELFVTSHGETLVKFDFLFDRQTPKTNTRMSLIAPQTRLSFNDNSEEIAKGKYKGSTDIEWGIEGKKLTIDYTTELMSDGNHEISMEIRAPGMKPIQHKHLVRLARDITLKTETMIDGKEYIVFEIKKEDQSLAFNFIGQMIKINYNRQVTGKKVDVKLDIRSKVIYSRPISLEIHKDSPGKKTHKLSVDLLWDAEANPDKKLSILLNTDREDGVKSDAKIEITNLINFSYKGTYVKGFIKGPNRAEFQLSGAKLETHHLIIGHVHSHPKGEGYITYTRGGTTVIDAKVGHEFTDARRYYYLTITGAVNRKLTITRDLASNVLTIEVDRAGKLYQLIADRKTDFSKGIIDLKVTLKLPYEHFASQELTVKGTIADGKVDITLNFLAGSGRNYNFVITGSRPQPRVADLQIAIKTDNENLKEGKAHLKYNVADVNNLDVELLVEADGGKIVDLDLKVNGKSHYDLTGTLKFSSVWTPSYVVNLKRSGDATKFISDMTVSQNDDAEFMKYHTEYANTGNKITFLSKSKTPRGELEIDFEKNVLKGDNHRTYKLDIKRNDQELKAEAETQRVDGFKITSVNVCRTPLDSNCVGVTVTRNVAVELLRNNEFNIKVHRKPDVTLEVDFKLIIPHDVHKAKVRLVGAINQCKLGVEYKCDHSTEVISEQSLRGFVIEREMLATRRREQTDKLIDIRYTAAFDAKSDEKFDLHYRREYNDKGGYTSNTKLSHPKMRTPIELKCKIVKGEDPNSLIRIESQLEWYAPEETLYFHFERRLNDETPRNRSVHLHIHKQNKEDLNLHVTLYRSENLQKPVFAGYYWSYRTVSNKTRVGQMKAYLGEDLKGYIDFQSPYQDDFKITGEAKVLNDEGDKEAEIVHLKGNVETRGKISYNLQKAYMRAVVLDAAGTEKREIEIDGGRREKGRYKIVLSSFPEGKKTTDLGIEHTRTSETSFQSRVYLPPEYIQRVAERAKEIAASSAGKYPIEDIKKEIELRKNAVCFKLKKIFEDMGEHLINKVTHIFVEVQNCLSHLINNTTVGQRLKQRLEANREVILKIIEKLREILKRCCPKLDAAVGQQLEKFAPKRSRRSVEDEKVSLIMYVAERVGMFVEWLDQTAVARAVRSVYQGACNVVNSAVDSVHRLFARAKETFLELPDVKQIADTWAELYDASSVGHVLPREAINKYIIQPRIESWKARAPLVEFDRKAGRFVADVDVPVDAKQLLQYWAYGVKPARDENKDSTLDMVVNSLSRVYDGHATVIEGNHFVTFDGRHYSAAGECSYLLARDFVDGNFSVMVSPGRELAYVVHIDDQYFDIKSTQKRVSVNGRPIHLPYHRSNGVSVTQLFDKIVIKDSRTLQFTAYLSRRTATLDLRIWYFGKTAGLFGNYNREPADDFVSLSGEPIEGEQQMLRSWEATKSCRSRTTLFRERTEDVEAVELCQKMFKSDDSPMSFGFLLRSADQYHDLCLRVAHGATRKVEAACQVAHAYLVDIERYGDLPGYLGARLPNECLTCELPAMAGGRGEFEIGSSSIVDLETGDSADVVFVAQESRCNALVAGHIPALVKSLEKELASRDIRQNRYGVVSFGRSEDVDEPFIRTARGQTFFPAKDLPLAFQGMNFSSTHNADTYLAIRQAIIGYRFRPTATKIIIALTCSPCDVIDQTVPDSVDLRTALLDNGIILHLVSKTDIHLRGSSPKRLDILGVDHSTAFTSRDAYRRESVGQPELRSQLRPPKDRCASLAQESRGSYFVTPRRHTVRAWRTIFSRRIAQDVTFEERCMKCECVPVENWSTMTACRPCKPYRGIGGSMDSDYEDIE